MHLTGGFEGDIHPMHMGQWLVWHTANRELLHYIFIVLKMFLKNKRSISIQKGCFPFEVLKYLPEWVPFSY